MSKQCKKIIYQSEHHANVKADYLFNLENELYRPYLCRNCKHWHLTTQTGTIFNRFSKSKIRKTSAKEVKRNIHEELPQKFNNPFRELMDKKL